jgi:hypothetical protein
MFARLWFTIVDRIDITVHVESAHIIIGDLNDWEQESSPAGL